MAGLVSRQLEVDLSQVGFETATEMQMVLRRATVADSFIIIPENFRVRIVLDGGIGEAELLPNTYGSIYDCTLLDAAKVKLAQFFFEMPDEDYSLTDLAKLTAWPMYGRPDQNVIQEIVAGTADAYESLEFGGYVTARPYKLKADNVFHVGAVDAGESAVVELLKNETSIGTVTITGNVLVFDLSAEIISFDRDDLLRLVVQSCSDQCRLVHVTLVVEFVPYNSLAARNLAEA